MAETKQPKFYVVWKGRKTGIFRTWDECKECVDKFAGAKYASFHSVAEAKEALLHEPTWNKSQTTSKTSKKKPSPAQHTSIIADSLAVDAACSGNPGIMEYRGVYTKTGEVIFTMGPFPEGTNNIGEFLAIVHGLALIKQKKLTIPIYSDSKIAMSWVQQKICKTKLERNVRNDALFDLVERAERWLHTNTYSTKIYKWETKLWGEIPADFGRK